MTEKKIAIVGGGVIGLALAWRLAEAGVAVTVIDAGKAEPAATLAAAGMLSPSFEMGAGAHADPMFELCLSSLRLWREFVQRLESASGVSIDYRPGGVMGAAFDAQEAARFADVAASVTLRGGDARLLNAAAARRREPALSETVVGALWSPEDAQVDPRLVSAALRRAIKRVGGAFIDGRVAAIDAEDGVVSRVAIADGDKLFVDAVVLAAGYAAAEIELPIPSPPIFPVKGEAYSVRADDDFLHSVVRGPGAYLCPKADGRIVVGASETPDDRSRDPDPDAIASLKAAARKIVPAIEKCPELGRWAGLRPATPDAVPILGRDPRGPANFHLAVGHYRNGVLLAPKTAELVMQEILSERTPRTLRPFSPDRFRV